MAFSTIVIVALIVALIGAIPTWPHSRDWGYRPFGTAAALLISVLIMVLIGRA